MKKTLAVVAGVVVIAYLASPLVIGLLARQQFPDIVKASSVGARQWQPDGFHLGYRHSTARSTLTLPMAGRRPVVVHLHHRITQRLGADLSIMEVNTTASFEGRIREELAQVFGDRSPFVFHTLIFADGHYTATFQSPPVASRSLPGNPAVHFSFSGAKGTVRGTFAPRTATYRMTSPGFALEDAKTHGRVAATGLALAGDG
ncbi:MAG TPA: DUF945 family protein, partial [Gammaproteobacteria bacterium]|nr:DUF945 family protein [Gammaproteobacteria bacterium]